MNYIRFKVDIVSSFFSKALFLRGIGFINKKSFDFYMMTTIIYLT